MKSKKFKKRRNKMKMKRRNASVGSTAIARPTRPRIRVPRRGEAPPWKTIGAAVAGSVGSAVASGLIVNQKIAEPETVALLMAATGGLGAYLTDGNARVAFTGAAAAGAGQYALLKLGDLAVKKTEKEEEAKRKAEAEAKAKAEAEALAQQQAQAQLSGTTAPAPAPRQHARGQGIVVDLFRDSAADLELLDEDEIRYSRRDADLDDDEEDATPIEIDLDDAA
jgi:hypothetical protein